MGLLIKGDPKVLPKGEKRAVDILTKTTKKENNRYYAGLLWKEDTITLSNNRSLAISRMISLEKKFDRQPDLKMKHVETTNQYIKDGHATKIDINKRTDNFNNKVNYILNHAVTNVNKPGKICIVFDAGAKCQNTSLNENLFKGRDLLNNLVGVLLRFCQGKFYIIANIERMFHQVMVDFRVRDALRFFWRNNRDEIFHDIQMNVHLFGKVDSPCFCIWALNKTASDNTVKKISRAEEAITDNFYMFCYLDSFRTVQEAIKVLNDVTNALSEGGFQLTK